MATLNDDSLRRIKLENDHPKQAFGRPVKLINDLLETISLLKKEKNKWQNLAKARKESLLKIQETASKSLTRGAIDGSDSSMGHDSRESS